MIVVAEKRPSPAVAALCDLIRQSPATTTRAQAGHTGNMTQQGAGVGKVDCDRKPVAPRLA
jgi:hypothetical protein